MTFSFGHRLGLAMSFGGELLRAYVRHPHLDRAIPTFTHASPMLPDSLTHHHMTRLHETHADELRSLPGVRHEAEEIIPAPTVRFVDSSISTKPPVVRLRRYSSARSGAVVRRRTRPMSLSPSRPGSSSRCNVLMSSRYCTSLTTVRADRVVCLIASFCPGTSGASVIQHTIASMSWATAG